MNYASIKKQIRLKKIIKSNNITISLVEDGQSSLIDSRGYYSVNTSSLRTYVKQKKENYNKLSQWKLHVEKYLNKSKQKGER